MRGRSGTITYCTCDYFPFVPGRVLVFKTSDLIIIQCTSYSSSSAFLPFSRKSSAEVAERYPQIHLISDCRVSTRQPQHSHFERDGGHTAEVS
jgi:hypothetical protein